MWATPRCSSEIRHRNQLTAKAWEKAVQELGKVDCTCQKFRPLKIPDLLFQTTNIISVKIIVFPAASSRFYRYAKKKVQNFYLSPAYLKQCVNYSFLHRRNQGNNKSKSHTRTPTRGSCHYLTHAYSHITREVAAMDSCFGKVLARPWVGIRVCRLLLLLLYDPKRPKD